MCVIWGKKKEWKAEMEGREKGKEFLHWITVLHMCIANCFRPKTVNKSVAEKQRFVLPRERTKLRFTQNLLTQVVFLQRHVEIKFSHLKTTNFMTYQVNSMSNQQLLKLFFNTSAYGWSVSWKFSFYMISLRGKSTSPKHMRMEHHIWCVNFRVAYFLSFALKTEEYLTRSVVSFKKSKRSSLNSVEDYWGETQTHTHTENKFLHLK